jgi:hypothetical protein
MSVTDPNLLLQRNNIVSKEDKLEDILDIDEDPNSPQQVKRSPNF